MSAFRVTHRSKKPCRGSRVPSRSAQLSHLSLQAVRGGWSGRRVVNPALDLTFFAEMCWAPAEYKTVVTRTALIRTKPAAVMPARLAEIHPGITAVLDRTPGQADIIATRDVSVCLKVPEYQGTHEMILAGTSSRTIPTGARRRARL